jgi:hypothetical protein
MPRQRKHNPSIPKHIDQRKLPVGIYWDNRDHYWYTIIREPRPHRQRIAGADALLSELHSEMEQTRGVDTRSLDWLCGLFAESLEYKSLSQATRDDYDYCRLALQNYKTKIGISFAELDRRKITKPLIRRLMDDIAKTHPSKANHVKRYLSVVFGWGDERDHCKGNPAAGVKQVKEKADHRMPEHDVSRAVIKLLRERGAMPSRRKGSVAPYVWAVAEIAYRCRMRGVEVRKLTDANATDAGVRVNRVKGSRDNVTEWCPELREAWNWLVARRAHIWLKKPALRARALRPLVVSEDGAALSKSALNSAWRRAMAIAIDAGVIDSEERFGLHGLKHRGVTDTPGNWADKKQASGHVEDSMVHLYDHEVPVVPAAGKPVDLRNDLRKGKK